MLMVRAITGVIGSANKHAYVESAWFWRIINSDGPINKRSNSRQYLVHNFSNTLLLKRDRKCLWKSYRVSLRGNNIAARGRPVTELIHVFLISVHFSVGVGWCQNDSLLRRQLSNRLHKFFDRWFQQFPWEYSLIIMMYARTEKNECAGGHFEFD